MDSLVILGLLNFFLATTVVAVDPYYIPKAKILTRQEVNEADQDNFKPSAIRCRKIGEKAARQRISCQADTDFYDSLSNRVHKTRLSLHEAQGRANKSMQDLAFRIGKCSVSYGKYFEKGCAYKSAYYAERRRCRKEANARERTHCKAALRRRFGRT